MSIKPGITGMWQVSGRSDITDFEEVVKLDTEYIEKWSIGLDCRILLKTVSSVLQTLIKCKQIRLIKLQRITFKCLKASLRKEAVSRGKISESTVRCCHLKTGIRCIYHEALLMGI